MDKKLIAVIAFQRSGTNVLQETISAGGQFKPYGEIFHEKTYGEPSNFFTFLAANAVARDLYSFPTWKRVQEVFDLYVKHLSALTAGPAFFIDIKYDSLHNLSESFCMPGEVPTLLRIMRLREV